MGKRTCDGCGERVRVGGGIGDFWTFETESTQGLTLELEDGSEWFLCYDCIGRLPDDEVVSAEDVETLRERQS